MTGSVPVHVTSIVGVVSAVMSSVVELPVSEPVCRSGAVADAGPAVSTVTARDGDWADSFPAVSVSERVTLWTASARVLAVKTTTEAAQVPVAATVLAAGLSV